MASSVYFPAPQRPVQKDRLPSYSSVLEEKFGRRQHYSPWTTTFFLPIPGVRTRRLQIVVPNPQRLHQLSVARFGRRRGPFLLFLAVLGTLFTVFAFFKRFGTESGQWPELTLDDPSTLVFQRDDLQRIWKWEIASGHYPSGADIPKAIGLTSAPQNPALPPRKAPIIPSRFRPPPGPITTNTLGAGPKRVYLDIQSQPQNVAYPPRPVPGSVADLDIIMENCNFDENKYVRDCLEVLRLGAGLDNENRLRRGKMDEWKYIYLESEAANDAETMPFHMANPVDSDRDRHQDPNAGLSKKRGADWETPLVLPPPRQPRPYKSLPAPCDEENPRMFHMFWTGPFTDKPYLALLSFLFTQNVGLNMHERAGEAGVCRPQFWLWINPGPAAAVPNPSATRDMYDQLKSNPWAAPFLHPRFHDVIKFKLWNTTEQLDGIPEIKDEWRALKDTLFNSGGNIIKVPDAKGKEQAKTTIETTTDETESGIAGNDTAQAKPSPTNVGKTDDDDMLSRTGSKSSSSYDRLSVILSDMARFVLCHRFGGIYLDADTIFLRDWEELWGWKGAFAYRWSRLPKYNTAVLHMTKHSAIGSFLFRTALKNGLDFHPMTVSRYMKDSHLEGLLLRLPDALFDSAWLNTELYQRDRPPQPYFYMFEDFFDTPVQNSAAPQALGFDGFFKGAYSYHFHNFWWKPFDPARNWPDLGPKFAAGERQARIAAAMAASAPGAVNPNETTSWEDRVAEDKRDLDWSTVLKRTFESYIRGERPNMYGEWISW